MKKIILALATALIGFASFNVSEAQTVLGKSDNVVNVGLGLGTYNNFAIVGSWDHGVVGNLFDEKSSLSLGVQGGFGFAKNVSSFNIGPTVGLHYHFIPELDTYVRLMLGLGGATVRNDGPNDTVSAVNSGVGFGWDLSLGTRYMFNPNIGAFIEVGYGASVANVGVAFKF